ncbi:hypothetical protein GOP47_0006334 [Adiantum capillus-veneris]|uniref:Enoyl reductase (ER) domain-containing protein n=1 Tax=Adiantum capillus-veneris TaxID=13818 RepID=A0A9D4V3N3_ADICA|nr:hypothetical protein GOP47_0006334 [Adiantum capillus-veneris]
MASKPQQVLGYAARDASGHLSPFTFQRRPTGADDVAFNVSYCGICHSDLHCLKNDWKFSSFPLVPGHEIVGIVKEVGSNVSNFEIGDHVGVGCLVGACGSCDACELNLDQYCESIIPTYNGIDVDGSTTRGGYSTIMLANHRFVFKMPINLPLDQAAPLLCAGISVYSPMKHFNMIEKGKKLGVVGLGGLGHMAIKFGKAFGLEVTVISSSPHKEKEAKEFLSVDHFLLSTNVEEMQKSRKTLDYIIDTISAEHAIDPLLNMLKIDGKLVFLGLPPTPLQLQAFSIIGGRRLIAGSGIGGVRETQEMLDFCGKHNITSIVEKVPISDVNKAMERLEKGDVKYRFVIDVANSLKSENIAPI